jgi:hypothetical protein
VEIYFYQIFRKISTTGSFFFFQCPVLLEEVQSSIKESSPSRGSPVLTEEFLVLAEGVQTFQRKSCPS